MAFNKKILGRRRKKLAPRHVLPGPPLCDFILLPYGYSYNSEYLEAKEGDVMTFMDGQSRAIVSTGLIPIEEYYTDALCKMRYGISIKRALQHWQNNAILMGHDKKIVSNTQCIIVFYGNIEKGETV